jgi:hypothetical protein
MEGTMRIDCSILMLGLAGCASAAGDSRTGAPSFGPEEVLSSATVNGATPMLLVTPRGERVISWVAQPDSATPSRLFVSVSGGSSAEPFTGSLVDPLGGIEPHGEAPPQLAASGDGAIYALYTVGKEVPGRRFPASALRFARSDDGGRTWSEPVSVNEGETFGSHNFHSLLAASNGVVYASWLSSVHGESGVWIRRSEDGGRTWTPSQGVHLEPTCPCCRTALAAGPDGSLYAAWRKIFPGDVRDIVVARSTDGGKTWSAPVRPREDGWVFPGCPHAGPSLKVGSDGLVHIAWWTGKTGEAGVYYARSDDGAQSFVATPIATGARSNPAHVQLALLGGKRVAVAWDDGQSETPGILLRVGAGSSFGKSTKLSASGAAATFPVLGASGDSLFVAWSQMGEAAHRAAMAAKADMSDPKAIMRLPRVGQTEIMGRQGAAD